MSSESGLPSELSKDKNVMWKVAAPKGHSSPIVAGGRIWITAFEGDERSLLCYDARTGAEIWRKSLRRARTEMPNPLNGPVTPTPVTDGKSVFVFYPEFGLAAYTIDGDLLWTAPLGPFGGVQGMAVSPILAGGNLIQLIDTPEAAYLAAFDPKTGRQIWKRERPSGFLGSYITPSLYQPSKGPEQIVVSGAMELTGYQAKTGERLWWARGVTYGPAASGVIAGDFIYTMEPAPDGAGVPPFASSLAEYDKNKNGKIELTEVPDDTPTHKIWTRLFRSIDKNSGNGDGVVTEDEFNKAFNPGGIVGGLVRTRLDGKGDITGTAAIGWRYTKGLPYVTAPLLYKNVIYVIRNGGILTTLNPENGTVTKEQRLKEALGEYYAQPVAADSKIYFVNKDGKVTVMASGGEVLSTGDLDEQVIATPAIADGRIFVRSESALWCFGKS